MRKLKSIFISLVLISFPMISFSQVVKYEKNIDGSYRGIYTKTTDDTLSETIVDLSLADSSTEYSYTLPSSCKEYEFQCEQNVDVRYSSGAGGTDTNYRTLKAGTTWSSWGRIGTNYANKTLYFKCPSQNNVVIQITIWNKL